MGDMLSLIEKAESTFDQKEAEKLQRKMMRNEFTLEDFLQQMQQVKRMGPIAQILDMIPGMGRLSKEVDLSGADDQFRRLAIIRSMTPHERRNPRILNASRKRRSQPQRPEVQDVNTPETIPRHSAPIAADRQGRLPRLPA
jgi:signal recognition particle subunit SRP54